MILPYCTRSGDYRLSALMLCSLLLGCNEPPAPTATAPLSPAPVAVKTEPAPTAHPVSYLERPLIDDVIYFVMTDRFANGDPNNDQGGTTPLTQGCFDPKDPRAFHGGDLKGLYQKLDYLQELGVTALWLTPVMVNRAAQAGSCGYHGYWGLDFVNTDPHLGTNDDLKQLIAAAHQRNIKVFLDMIANHTADVISYAGNPESYRPLEKPAYSPVVDPRWANVKNPAWLNNPAYYNNRGDSTFAGESAIYGDFHGLDDLDTRQQTVISGMIDIFKFWIREYQVDGFRLDTVKHVDIGLWQRLAPSVIDYAHKQGIPNFTMFGEIFDHQPALVSRYTSQGKLPSALDFPLQGVLRDVFSRSGDPGSLFKLLEDDDYYLAPHQDARQLVTFSGNHDKGRFGFFLKEDGVPENEWLSRSQLVNAFLLLGRGAPSLYYGDEQGFTGEGGDSDARQDMFASQVDAYRKEARIGGGSGKTDSFDLQHPLFQQWKQLIAVRKAHLALRQGLQLPLYSDSEAGILAFSRIDPQESREYLVLFNTSTKTREVRLNSLTARSQYRSLLTPEQPSLHSNEASELSVKLPPLSYGLYRADGLSGGLTAQISSLKFAKPLANARVRDRVEIQADIQAKGRPEVEFSVKIGEGDYQLLGTDWTSPYRIFWDTSALTGLTPVTLRIRSLDNQAVEHLAELPITFDPRQLEQLSLHYENPHQANRLLLLSDKGELRGPYNLAQEHPLPLTENDSQIHLLYAQYQPDDIRLEAPISLSIDQLLESLPAGGGNSLNLYINRDKAIATNPNFYSDQAPESPAEPRSEALAPLSKPLYLRGTMTDWQAIRAMEPHEHGLYWLDTLLEEGEQSFKFADSSWNEALNFGAPITEQGLTSSGQSGNLKYKADKTALYRVYLQQTQTKDGIQRFPFISPLVEVDSFPDTERWLSYKGRYRQTDNGLLTLQVTDDPYLDVEVSILKKKMKFYPLVDGRFASRYGLFLTIEKDAQGLVTGLSLPPYGFFRRDSVTRKD